jgi:hypothetical protein
MFSMLGSGTIASAVEFLKPGINEVFITAPDVEYTPIVPSKIFATYKLVP